MAPHRVTHDLEEDPVVYDNQVLDEPLEFEDGEATLESEDAARNLARRHTHVEYGGRVYAETDSEDGTAEPPIDPAEQNLDELEEALKEGDFTDEELDAIRAAEEADDSPRSGATDLIEAAREE